MRRWLPFPIVSACVLGMWLLLNQSASLGQILLGAIIAVLGGWLLAALQPTSGTIQNPAAIARLAGLVLVDIVRSNIAVCRIILGSHPRNVTSGFVNIPLELRSQYGLAALAAIITSTPGTLWVSFNAASGVLVIHVLDLVDEQTWIKYVKHRYERPLLEIFP